MGMHPTRINDGFTASHEGLTKTSLGLYFSTTT
jgi:hypothetical protein